MITKRCSRCDRHRGEEAFSRTSWIRPGQWCRECATAYQFAYQRTPAVKAKRAVYENSPKVRAQKAADRQRRIYGLTMDERDALIAAQGGRCGCCGCPFGPGKNTAPCTDHTTDAHGKVIVRGILCNLCNTGIGRLGDDLAGVLNAVRYLTGVV